MAAPHKKGLEYFPLDINIDNDEKVSMIIAEYGKDGELFLIKLFSWIYGHDGYYTEWNEATKLQFNHRYKYCGFTIKFMDTVILKSIHWKIFDQGIHATYSILTSCRIQETWIEVTRKRKDRTYRPLLWLISYTTGLTPEGTKLIPEEMNKGKESKNKVEESILADGAASSDNYPINGDFKNGPQAAAQVAAPPKLTRTGFKAPTKEDLKNYFLQKAGDPKQINSWMPDQCHVEAFAMFNYYEANGWKQGRGKSIVCWEAAANQWILNCKRGTFAVPDTTYKNSKSLPPAKIDGPDNKTKLTPAQISVNYLFERYKEAPADTTVISIEGNYLNEIVKANLYELSQEDKQQLRGKAVEYLQNNGKTITEDNETNFAKKFAVLKFFEKRHGQGYETVF